MNNQEMFEKGKKATLQDDALYQKIENCKPFEILASFLEESFEEPVVNEYTIHQKIKEYAEKISMVVGEKKSRIERILLKKYALKKKGKRRAELNKTVIYKNGDAFAFGSSAFYVGGLDHLVSFNKDFFKWNVDDDASKFEGETVYYLTLGELKEQLAQVESRVIITLFVNKPTSGEIYQIGNYKEYEWFELGNLKGFC